MKKSDLSSHVATEASLSKAQASAVVDAVFSAISDALTRDESVAILGFGTFATKIRGARQGRNLHTGESIATAPYECPRRWAASRRAGGREGGYRPTGGRANTRVTSRQIRHARAIRAFMSRSKRP